MKKINHSLVFAVFLQMLILVLPRLLEAQTKATSAAKLVIEGTSNIHDWIMTSTAGNCSGQVTTDLAGVPTAITNLNFQVGVTTLKSEKGSTMDNNAYKAMAAEKYPSIKFSSANVEVKPGAGGTFTVTAPGKLTISSGTREVTLTASGKVNPDKSITFDGSYKLTTTDYNVKPISIMLGAIKTSPDVKIIYQLTLK